MSDPKREHRGWYRWLLLLAIVATLAIPLVLFWERAMAFVCVRMLCYQKTYDWGAQGLVLMRWRAFPALRRYAVRRPGKVYGRVNEVVPLLWRSLSSDDVEALVTSYFEMEVTTRPIYSSGRPVTYMVAVSPNVPIWGDIELLERGELLGETGALSTFELTHRGLGGVPDHWCTQLGASRIAAGGIETHRVSGGPAARLQEPGRHQLRISLALVDARLATPIIFAEETLCINTVESLPPGYFVPISCPGINEAMRKAFAAEIGPVQREPAYLYMSLKQTGDVPVPFAGRPVLRVRETDQELQGPVVSLRLPGNRRGRTSGGFHLHTGRPTASGKPGLQRGKTYHFQVVFRPDAEGAWLDPRIITYWGGELESDWVEVTIPRVKREGEGPARLAGNGQEEKAP